MSKKVCATVSAVLALLISAGPAEAASTLELDTAWAQGGKLFGRGETALVQPDGRLVTWSTADDGKALQLTRFTPSGALDTSFGAGGYARVVVPQREPDYPRTLRLGDMVRLPDGRFLLLVLWNDGYVTALRLLADASIDASFAGNGALVGGGDGANPLPRLAVGPGGRFAVASTTYDDHRVQRFRADGTPEPVNPVVDLPYISNCPRGEACQFESANPVDLYYRPDGKLGVLMSTTAIAAGTAVVQLTADGATDTGWSGDGVMHLSLARAHGVVLLPGGDLLVSGEGQGTAWNVAPKPPIRVARIAGTGRLRASFGRNGIASAWNGALSTQQWPTWSTAGDLAVDGQGRIVVAGTGLRYADREETYCSVTRFTAGGHLDLTYSLDADGTATDGRSTSFLCEAIAVVPGDRYLVSARSSNINGGDSATLQEMFIG